MTNLPVVSLYGDQGLVRAALEIAAPRLSGEAGLSHILLLTTYVLLYTAVRFRCDIEASNQSDT